MLTLTKRELAVFAEAQPDCTVSLNEIEHEGGRWWLMRVSIPANGKVYLVHTSFGKTKLWKRLDIAVDFIKECCPHIKRLDIVF